MSEWIECKEIMPAFVGTYLHIKYSENVLCLSQKVGMQIAHYCEEHDGYKKYWRGDKRNPIRVTHWMPLPAPPVSTASATQTATGNSEQIAKAS